MRGWWLVPRVRCHVPLHPAARAKVGRSRERERGSSGGSGKLAMTVARAPRNNGSVTAQITTRIATTLAMTKAPPNVITQRAIRSRRLTWRSTASLSENTDGSSVVWSPLPLRERVKIVGWVRAQRAPPEYGLSTHGGARCFDPPYICSNPSHHLSHLTALSINSNCLSKTLAGKGPKPSLATIAWPSVESTNLKNSLRRPAAANPASWPRRCTACGPTDTSRPRRWRRSARPARRCRSSTAVRADVGRLVADAAVADAALVVGHRIDDPRREPGRSLTVSL